MSDLIASLPYIYRWDRQGRKGQPCDVLIRTKVMNSCLVKFADGYTMVTSRNALMKNKAQPHSETRQEQR
ncbi:hypothetical protein JVX98_13115 [Ensifer sp. PDNC004]|uniref:hypothetical protein n=1 Tax=Ensifer sp. PDNC004 TaxID=2811423 RepID=UPI0019633FF9|nr:hypothetical protein [Ensifer sp. PDNC004]QRY69158.1 hypothetical protein JVX98_13115 [Ensifer sp. PDNC004]